MKLKNGDTKKSKTCLDIASETYKDFAENTSIHGLKYTVKSELGYWEKGFWIMVIIGGFCGAAYMTMLFWERYVDNPTRTTILTSTAPTTSMSFPAVTICNINRILVSKIDEFMNTLSMYESEKPIIRNAIPQLITFTHPNVMVYNMTELNVLQEVLEKNNVHNMSAVLRSLGQSCDEMLLYCSWNAKFLKCNEIFEESLTVDGYCCSFNYVTGKKGSPRYTGFNGIGSGLIVILNSMLQPVQYSSLYASGFKVIIHDPFEYPGSQSTTRIISVNKVSYMQIYGTKMTCSDEVKNLPLSQRHCIYSHEYELESLDDEYSASNCLTECDANFYYNRCGCVPFYFSILGKPLCNITDIPCLHDAKSYDTGTRKCNCMPQCEDDYYNVLTASTTFDEKKLSLAMISTEKFKFLNDSLIVNVFFLRQTQLVYLRDTITSTLYLLSSFGGVYSLFMGCSLITIAEIIYYFFRFVVNLKLFGKVNGDEDDVSKMEIPKKLSFLLLQTLIIIRFEIMNCIIITFFFLNLH